MTPASLAALPARFPRRTLAVAGAAALLAVWAACSIHPEASLEAMFTDNDPAAAALIRVFNNFATVDELLLLVETPDGRPTDPAQLEAFGARLHDAVLRTPAAMALVRDVVYRAPPQAQKFFQETLAPKAMYYLDPNTLQAAQQRLSPAGMRAQIRQDEALLAAPGPAAGIAAKLTLRDPLRLHEFILDQSLRQVPFATLAGTDAIISPDGRCLLVRIAGRRPPSDLDFCQAVTDQIAAVAEQVNTDHLDLRYTGAYPIAALSGRSIRHDMITSVIGSVVFLQLLFVLAYRRPIRLFALAFGPVALGVLYGFGLWSLTGLRLTPMTGVVGAILAGMGIDYSIQYLSCYERRRLEGLDASAAAQRVAGDIGAALLAAWATSIIGFLAIAWSSVSAIRGFALLGTLGLTGCFLCAITVLPATLALTDRPRFAPGAPGQPSARSRLRFNLAPALQRAARHRRPLLTIAAAIMLLAIGTLLFTPGAILELEPDLTVMHPHPNPPLDAADELARRFGIAPESLMIYLHADSPPALVALAHDVDNALHGLDVRTYGLAALLPDPRIAAARLAAVDPARATQVVADFNAALADSIFEPAQYQDYARFLGKLVSPGPPPTLGDVMACPGLADALLPRAAVESGAPPTEALTLVFTRSELDRRADRDAAVTAVRAALKDLPGATLTGLGVIGYDADQTVRHDLPRFLLVAAVVTLLYLVLHFRAVRPALLALLPAVFSLVCLLAAMLLCGRRLNMVNLIALPLLIGIDVDYGIFLVSLARRGDQGLTASAYAVLICAAATFLGFGSLAFTSVPAICSLGWAVGVGILACAVAVFLLLIPALLAPRSEPGA